MAGSFVLSRVSRCSVAQGYASLDPLHAALLNGHFEHPAGPEARGLDQKIVKATPGRYTGIRLFLEEAYCVGRSEQNRVGRSSVFHAACVRTLRVLGLYVRENQLKALIPPRTSGAVDFAAPRSTNG